MTRGSRIALGVLGTLLLLLLALVVTRGWWLPALGEFLVVGDPLQPADAVVVLGGGKRERAAYGASLVAEGWAPWLIVPDMPFDVPGIRTRYADLMRQEAEWAGVRPEQIVVEPGISTTTVEEARATGAIARQLGLRRVIVITEPYHTRRARMVFRDTLKGEALDIAVLSPPNTTYRADAWWTTNADASATSLEYLKLAAWLAGAR